MHAICNMQYSSIFNLGPGQSVINTMPQPHWFQAEGCYDRILICERFDSNDPTCSTQNGHLGISGFRIVGARNTVEIEGRSILTTASGGIRYNGTNAVWKTMTGMLESTSVVTSSRSLVIERCESRALLRISGSSLINATYNFSCQDQALEPSDAGIIFFRDLGWCSDAQSAVLIVVRQGSHFHVYTYMYASYNHCRCTCV